MSETAGKKSIIAQLKARLFAYPTIKANIERYKKDIEGYQDENFGRSKSIVVFAPRGGEPFSVEDCRAARILTLEKFIDRDEYEIKEIDSALQTIRDDYYYPIIPKYFFERKRLKKLCREIPCDVSTASRKLENFLYKMSLVLYGAAVLK